MSGEYLRRLSLTIDKGMIDKGTAAHAYVAHDKWCKSHRGKSCNCDPDITVKTSNDGIFEILKDGSIRPLKSA